MMQNKLYLTFGLSYSLVIGFLLYGPLMGVILGNDAYIYTILSLVAFILAFLNPRLDYVSKNIILKGLVVSLAMFFVTVFQFKANSILKASSLIVFAFAVATICRCFTLQAFQEIKESESEKTIAAAFFIAFFILYGLNGLRGAMSPLVGLIILSMLTVLMSYYFVKYMNVNYMSVDKRGKKIRSVVLPLLALYLIYIGGGVSYVGIYPNLSDYARIDRFYNVLPLLVSLPISVVISKRFGYMANLVLGIFSLSLSFGFFLLPLSAVNYFIIQTCLQIGWGFMNVFGFSYSWRLAKDKNEAHIFGYGILSILIGVTSGSVVANTIVKLGLPVQYYGLITFIPIVTSLIIFFFYQDRQKEEALLKAQKVVKKVVTVTRLEPSKFNELEVLSELTKREKEVMYLYYCSESAAKIAERLNISQNTVRSHIKKSYIKLEINKRDELKKLINENA